MSPATPEKNHPDADLARILAADAPSPWLGRLLRWGLVLLGAAVVVGGGVLFLRSRSRAGETRYLTAEVTRGDLTVNVSATGNLAPLNQVDVGSELSGTVLEVFVDANARVRKGEVLARLDTAKLEDEVARAQAAVTIAEAKVAEIGATIREAEATLARYREVAALSGGKVPSKTEFDAAEAVLARAGASRASALGTVENARAELRTSRTNVTKASIRSPIDGVVLARSIEPGQTVAASFSAPVLFTLAESLEQMELRVAVDEADVGEVREGQPATFTVDAYPSRTYSAQVTRVGLGATTSNNIVSYQTLLTFTNADLSLRPGMTGSAEITTLERTGVLRVPNAALRWSPPEGAAASGSRGLIGTLMPRMPGRRGTKVAGERANGEGERRLWTLRDGVPLALTVRAGASDGVLTEVSSPELKPGVKVITGTETVAK